MEGEEGGGRRVKYCKNPEAAVHQIYRVLVFSFLGDLYPA